MFSSFAYAHLLSNIGSNSRQAFIHASRLTIAALTLPVVPAAEWKPTGDEAPGLRITLLLLTACSLCATMLMLSRGSMSGVVFQIALLFGNLFVVCMFCHGELVRLKPD